MRFFWGIVLLLGNSTSSLVTLKKSTSPLAPSPVDTTGAQAKVDRFVAEFIGASIVGKNLYKHRPILPALGPEISVSSMIGSSGLMRSHVVDLVRRILATQGEMVNFLIIKLLSLGDLIYSMPSLRDSAKVGIFSANIFARPPTPDILRTISFFQRDPRVLVEKTRDSIDDTGSSKMADVLQDICRIFRINGPRFFGASLNLLVGMFKDNQIDTLTEALPEGFLCDDKACSLAAFIPK